MVDTPKDFPDHENISTKYPLVNDRTTNKRNNALEGTRIVDFTWSVAGPTITTYLAALGAEVIKVEWPLRPDMMRKTMFADGVAQTLDSGCFFATVNPGKRGLSCDMRTDEGKAIVAELIKNADMVTESFSAGVLAKWGFTYEKLCELREDIIYLSLSGFGHTGPYSAYNSWGPTAQAFNGLTLISGVPGEIPAGWGFSYMDVIAGYMGTVAALSALYSRKRTGEGQYIDISQIETGIALSGSAILDASVNGRGAGRVGLPPGNRSMHPEGTAALGLRGEIGAPYNCYPTSGGGRFDFAVITVLSEKQWLALTEAMGNPKWSSEERFSTMAGRLANQNDLDTHISSWTVKHEKYALMQTLQEVGVPCGAVQSMEDLVESDQQLRHRGMFVTSEHPLLGKRRWQNFPFSLSETPPTFEGRWPLFGQDNEYVLGDILGLSSEEQARLASLGITWPKGLPHEITVERALW